MPLTPEALDKARTDKGGVTLPSGLRTIILIFGYAFDQNLEGLMLPSSLQILTFCY